MELPEETRLSYVSASKPEDLTLFIRALPSRVQIYGCPVWVASENKWYLWFVPDDRKGDIPNKELD